MKVNASRPGRAVQYGAVVLAVLLAAGCGAGKGRTSVGGTVTYRGAPVPGRLMLQTTVEGAAVTYPVAIGPNGRFTTAGVPEGVYQVSILPAPPAGGSPRPANAQTAAHVDLPPRYLRPDASGLTLDIKGGNVTKDFVLTD